MPRSGDFDQAITQGGRSRQVEMLRIQNPANGRIEFDLALFPSTHRRTLVISRHPTSARPMSALPPKADMGGAQAHVRYVPIADMAAHSITSSARCWSDKGTSSPSAFAVLRLIAISYLVGVCTGRSADFAPFRIRST